MRAAARGRPPLQLLYSFSNLLYGWSVSPIRPAHTTWRQNENRQSHAGSNSAPHFPEMPWRKHQSEDKLGNPSRIFCSRWCFINNECSMTACAAKPPSASFSYTRSMELFISMGNENNCPPYQFCNRSYGLLLTAYYCVPCHRQTSLLMSVVVLNRFSPPYLCRLEGCLYFVLW